MKKEVRRALAGYVQVGRCPAFRRFWLGMMISRSGDAFTLVALSWVVLQIAGPVQLGVVLMCFGLPRIVGGPLAGRLLDRPRPGLLLVLDNTGRGLLIAVVPVLLWRHELAVADLCGIAAASALLSSLTEVAEAALVPRLVPDGQLDAANALLSANWEVASIAGPAVAGAGALIGLVAGTSLPGRLPPSRRIAVVILSGAPLFGLLRVAPGLPVAAGLLALAMFAWGPYFVFDRTLVQRLVPDGQRSRVVGARMTISSLGFPLGSAAGGAVLGGLGARDVILAMAGCYLVLGLVPLFTTGLRTLDPGRAAPRIQTRPTPR